MRILMGIVLLIALGCVVINIIYATLLVFLVYLPIGIVMAMIILLTICILTMFIHIYRLIFGRGKKKKSHAQYDNNNTFYHSRYYRDWYNRTKRY